MSPDTHKHLMRAHLDCAVALRDTADDLAAEAARLRARAANHDAAVGAHAAAIAAARPAEGVRSIDAIRAGLDCKAPVSSSGVAW